MNHIHIASLRPKLSSLFSELLNMISFLSSMKVEAVSEAFENFQLKTYGVKTQVHDTPDKKKRRR